MNIEVGSKFHDLTVVSRAGKSSWCITCTCGKSGTLPASLLVWVKSCGVCRKNRPRHLPIWDRYTKYKAASNISMKLLHTKRTKNGKCQYCGTKLKRHEKRLCSNHRSKQRNSQIFYQKDRRAHGICIACRLPALVGNSRCEEHWFKLRSAVLKNRFKSNISWQQLRDIWYGQNGKDAYTGELIVVGNKVALDHKIPVSRGGATDKNNLCWTNIVTNRVKGALTAQEFLNLCCSVANNRSVLI